MQDMQVPRRSGLIAERQPDRPVAVEADGIVRCSRLNLQTDDPCPVTNPSESPEGEGFQVIDR